MSIICRYLAAQCLVRQGKWGEATEMLGEANSLQLECDVAGLWTAGYGFLSGVFQFVVYPHIVDLFARLASSSSASSPHLAGSL
ncbi:hypothetical protein DFH94DRAFT_129298 [Russula ochroleuca]|uniref:Uncharacterized protein n=1 Tax=Russula ochroleuca TaxID=152965 RepID=A0A9P5K212_9AGAM|nr:hypothetical protein DFH94DRAFT_129298 [Russula ochroleuca]